MSNQELRERILKKRASQSHGDRARFSLEIQEKILNLLGQKNLKTKIATLALYRSTTQEVGLDEMTVELIKRKIRIVFPVCLNASEMMMIPVSGNNPLQNSIWEKSNLGLWEPKDRSHPISPQSIDCILVPGIVFSKSGYRLGRGAGFYDRYLKQAPQALKCGVGFELQVVEDGEIQPEEWDVPMDALVTEKQVRWFASIDQGFRVES